MAVEQLVEKVKDRTANNPYDLIPVDPFDSLCWFIAYHEAQQVLEAFTTKDLASMIVKGDSIGGPYKTAKDVRGWIETVEQDAVDEDPDLAHTKMEAAWEWLDEALDQFYGITKE